MIHDSYVWRGGSEAVIRCGDTGPTVLILAPLFEEANRMRRSLVQVMRGLARDHAIATLLPDLPGTGDSMMPAGDVRLGDWHDAVAALAQTLPRPRYTAAFRGGALLDTAADADFRWRLSPEPGERLLRDMVRATALSSRMKPAVLEAEARKRQSVLLGNPVDPALFVALSDAVIPEGPATTVTLSTEVAPSDRVLPASPPWRRAEPVEDAGLVSAIVADIAGWVRQCAA